MAFTRFEVLTQNLAVIRDHAQVELEDALSDEVAALQDLLTCDADTDSGDRDRFRMALVDAKIEVQRWAALVAKLA